VIAGVDRYRRGWVAVRLDPLEVVAATRLRSLLEPDAVCVGVDMPIGLRADGLRECDRLARKRVGPRWSSVFMTPPRRVLEAESFQAANALAPALMGAKISQQAWALRHTIFEVEELGDPRVIEVHPEVSFAAMAGAHLAYPKSTWNGQMLRRRILAGQGIELPDELGEAGHVPAADVLDAAAVAWSAGRYARGIAGSLPEGARHGRREVIWY
jgi:predicted RNase H-like nuclease